jgi:hypothetical protein
MESLATLILIIFLLAFFSGPLAIALTSSALVNFLNSKFGIFWTLVDVLRKIIHLLAISIGTFLGFSLLTMGVTFPKLIGVYAIALAYIALRREYFPGFYVMRRLLRALGVNNLPSLRIKRKEEPPVFSADGTEIVRAKRSKRFGRTSGKDGHGPAGQH